MNRVFSLLSAGAMLFAVLPANSPQTTTYGLQSYGFGSGGTANSTTSTYALEGQAGDFNGASAVNGTTDSTRPGYIVDQQANVPKFSSIDNASGIYYNKLHFVIDQQNNPSDAKYLIAVSTSATLTSSGEFTSPLYLHTDGTLQASFTTADYQTYAGFGGATGSIVIGLNQNTSYYFHLKATQGKFTESGYGPVVNQPTAPATLTFSLVTSANGTPPFTVGLGTLNAGTINTSAQTINTSLSTNGTSGGDVYIKGQNGGLLSSSTTYKIAALSADLSAAGEGFGARNNSVTQSSGSTYSVVAPYNTGGTTVGIIDSTTRSLYTVSGPVTGGAGVLALLAKAASTDIAASDYQEVLTFIAAANY
jgi:hypothetical protein